ncbi:MAG TPA: tetratricopeptide repeat protein [Thermoanaerobaculia bacterium]|jgi:tetratricopeptide (TPR) repeat protein
MVWHVVIAHAPGEEKLAETIADRLREAGYGVSHRGTVLVGESFTEEAGKALRAGGPVILCATINALGTGWVHHLINSAFAQTNRKRIFALRVEQKAYLDQVLGNDIAVAEYWANPEEGIQSLLTSLRKHFPLETEPVSPVAPESPPPAYLDRITNISRFNAEALKSFRAELRASITKSLPPDLDALEFLRRSNLMRNGFLTLTGLLLFGDAPTHALASAFSRFTVYSGTTKTDPREPIDVRGTVIDQITGLHQQVTAQVRTRERVREDSPKAEVLYEYPMRTIREIVANALVHRDYEDVKRWAHVRLFTDRIEVLSPGDWVGVNLLADGSPIHIGALVSESVKRNLTLATVVAWARLVEGEGSGLPTVLEECREISAPEPVVSFKDGFIKVTIFPRGDWSALEHPVSLEVSIPSLHQLPAAPLDFTGRAQELERLSGVVQGRVGLLGIQGLGGVGKTALALKLAESLKPSYPDAQIFLNLGGTSPRPVSTAEAMAHVIRSFHPQARLPESEPEIAGLYRSVLDGKRILLVLDDAGDHQQVEPLIPPPPSLLLLTSRSRFSLPGLVVEQLDVLSSDEARALLLHLAPRIGDAVDEIARLCGYLPLALRLVGATLAGLPDLSAQEYIRRFSAAFGEETPVVGSIRLSYDCLHPALQRHWNDLSVFPSSFDRTAVEAVLALSSEAADRVLGGLVRNSLLEWNEHGRYYLHPLLRAFAESQLDAAEGQRLRLRHAEHYLGVLARSSELYEQGGEGVRQALELFDREWENVRSGFAWTAENASQDEAAAWLCASYPNAGAYCLDLRLSPREHIRWLEPALRASHRTDPAIEMVLLGNLGNAYMGLGEIDRAALLYEEWLKAAREAGDRRIEGDALGDLGIAYASRGETQRALQLFERHLAIAQELGDRRAEGISLGNLGITYAALGELQRAVELFELHLVISREIGDRRSEGTSLGNLGTAFLALGEPRRAMEFFEGHLAISREIGDRHGEGVALGSLGDIRVALGEPERAGELYRQALVLLRELGDRPRETEISRKLGRVSGEGESAARERS